MIRIAQAASSETGTAYGTPPNQLRTGVTPDKPEGNLDGELNVIPFYPSNWRAVLRAKNEKIRERIADIAYKIVANGSKDGYGQQLEGPYARTGVFDALYAMADPDPWKIQQPVNCDCTSLAGAAVYFAGVYNPDLRRMNSTTEPGLLLDTGEFVWLDDKELLEAAVGCRRGDLYWRPGHTMIVLDDDDRDESTPVIVCDCSACNMRTGPSKDYPKIRTLHPGDIVQKISTADTGWIHILVDGAYGYMSPKYFRSLPTGHATGNVWMRTEAGKISKETEIIVIPSGASVYLTGETKKVGIRTWYDCFYAGLRGWASGLYIEED